MRVVNSGINDLKTLFPEISKEWNYAKNNSLIPSEVLAGSAKIVFWTCPDCKHDYDMAINKRTKRGYKCPFCSGHRVLKGFNDLASTYPDIAKEWNMDKNSPLLSSDVVKSSGKNVWWKCSHCGNEWQTRISTRVSQRAGCPQCSIKRRAKNASIVPKENSLMSLYPKLIEEWNFDKNIDLVPENIGPGSNKKVWWICNKCKYEWKSAIVNRAIQRHGCPRCAITIRTQNRRIAKNGNDIFSANAQLEYEWNYEKNAGIDPKITNRGSDLKVW